MSENKENLELMMGDQIEELELKPLKDWICELIDGKKNKEKETFEEWVMRQ